MFFHYVCGWQEDRFADLAMTAFTRLGVVLLGSQILASI